MEVAQLVGIILLGAVVILLSIFVIKNVAAPKKVEGVQRYLKQGKIQAAIKLAKSILQKDPKDYLAHYHLGRAYLADNKNELALMELKYVDQNGIFDNRLPEQQFRKSIAALYTKFNQPQDALKQYLLLTKLEPTVADNYFQVAQIYENSNHPDMALGFYDKTLMYDKRNVKAHAAMGLLLYRAKQVNEAKREIEMAIKLSPETFSTYYYQGKILKDAKDYPGAIRSFEKAQRDPQFRQKALIESGSCYMMGNSVDNAMNCYERAISADKEGKNPETLYARYFLAACYEKTHKIEKAIEQWQKIASRQKNFRDVGQKLAEYKDLQANDSLKEYLTSIKAKEFPRRRPKAGGIQGLAGQRLAQGIPDFQRGGILGNLQKRLRKGHGLPTPAMRAKKMGLPNHRHGRRQRRLEVGQKAVLPLVFLPGIESA